MRRTSSDPCFVGRRGTCHQQRRDSVVTTINRNAGAGVEVDSETVDLIDYSVQCHQLSGGRFDITSGALRRAWRFDRATAVPTAAQVDEAVKSVGWDRVEWQRPRIRLAAGMEIDFGGDLRVTGPRTGMWSTQVSVTEMCWIRRPGGRFRTRRER